MNRKFASNLAVSFVALVSALCAGVVTRANAGGDPASGDPPFVSTLSREEVTTELKKPYPGGNPWSGQYNMFQNRSEMTADQVQGEFIKSRDNVRAFTSEDSGSAWIMKSGQLPPGSGSAMGGPAR
jgi:hypothetical protein